MNKVKLKDVCLEVGKYGIPASAVDFNEDLYRYLRITDISDDGNLLENDIKSLNEKDVEKYFLSKNDIVFARTGASTGRSFFYEKKYGILVFAGFLIKFKINEKLVNPKFIKYYTISQKYKKWIENCQDGSTRGNMNANTFANMEIDIPDRKQQDLAVSILSSLDAKIELNNKINKELENMAKTIYDYWFIQNADKSWEKKKIGEIAEVIRGTMITEEQTKKGNVKVVAAGLDYSYFHSEFNREKNTITISGSGANAGFVNFWYEQIFASDCTTVRGEEDIDTILIYYHLKSNQKNIFRSAKGSAQPHVYLSDIKDIWFYKIPQNIKDKLSHLFLATNDQIAKNLLENNTLVQLRDFLLPLLMNGQVTVKAVESKKDIISFKNEDNNDKKLDMWLQGKRIAARGETDLQTLHEIFNNIDDDDK
jgi:type I restriction enzyme S subunit